ncbi:MAG: hypothetical protein KGH67_01690 [Candidatus Micrarchaeota archaeon]|nr:hypothetical protein [Candidatus Micrarchaeota archaeon]MDE1859219.1 hypothetical protein [Candidatus Micrarchaeota archaeon]
MLHHKVIHEKIHATGNAVFFILAIVINIIAVYTLFTWGTIAFVAFALVISVIAYFLLGIEKATVLFLSIIIIALAIYLRSTMLSFYGFYEPDGFYYYSMVRATVNNNFHVPAVLSTSGWPNAAPYTEAQGLLWVTLIPYMLLHPFGVSYYWVMRHMAVLFGLLDMLGAYLLSRYLSKDKLFGLLVIAFVGFSMGNAARTSALIYRGDAFVSFFLLMALVLLVETLRQETRNRKILFAVLAGVALLGANLVWNGGSFADATFLFTFMLLIAIAFVLRKESLAGASGYVLLSIFVWYFLALITYSTGFIKGEQLITPSFLPVYIAITLLWVLGYYLTINMHNFPILRKTSTRLIITIAAISLGIMLFSIIESGLVYGIFVGNGIISAPNSVGSTIQELQPPTYAFLYTSFGVNLFTTAPTLLIIVPILLNLQNLIWIWSAGVLGVILLFVFFLPYFFMQVYDSGGLISGNARARFDVNMATVAIMAYFILTAYLQMHAIRFNSLLSVPLAIISAYTIYWLFLFAKGSVNTTMQSSKSSLYLYALSLIGLLAGFFIADTSGNTVYAIVGAIFGCGFFAYIYKLATAGRNKTIVMFCSMLLLAASMPSVLNMAQNSSGSMSTFAYIVVAVTGLALLLSMYYFYNTYGDKLSDKDYIIALGAFSGILLIAFFTVLLINDNAYAVTLFQADNINPQFISALQWLKGNSTPNSVVLTLWPDGSVVEGVANRTVVTDSVGSQNGSKLTPFAAWILNGLPDPQFLESPINGKPNYVLVRFPWFVETQGIYTEAMISENQSLFGYLPLTRFEELAPNSTTSQLIFRNNATGYPFAAIDLTHGANNYSRSSISGFIQISPNSQSVFKYVGFYDQDNFNFTLAPIAANNTNGELMLVSYSSIPKQGYLLNITGAYIFAPGLASSNMLKFLYFCNANSCAWDTKNATARLVYGNSDTKIFKITYYNSTYNYT